MIVAQKSAQSLAAPYRPLALPICRPRKQQDVTLALMIALGKELCALSAFQSSEQGQPDRWPIRLKNHKNNPAAICLFQAPDSRAYFFVGSSRNAPSPQAFRR
jgi:hypothetical protein